MLIIAFFYLFICPIQHKKQAGCGIIYVLVTSGMVVSFSAPSKIGCRPGRFLC